jgi:hypothetical protein
MSELKIDNSKKSAITDGKWEKPGADFYDKLLKESNWEDCLKEAYLIAPVKNITNNPRVKTPYSNSKCKYPHHVLKDGKLVVSIPGIKAAYSRACQQGVLSDDIKSHLKRHIKELGIEDQFEKIFKESSDYKIESNFNDIYNFLLESADIDLRDDVPLTEEDSWKFDNDEDKIGFVTSDDKEDAEFVPVFGISKSYSTSKLRNNGDPKSHAEISSMMFKGMITKLTNGDLYSHSLVSFDESMTKMYSYDNIGFVVDNMMTDESFLGTDSVYICVMFVTKEEKQRMMDYVQDTLMNKDKTQYAMSNLLTAFIATPSKVDKRFVCSSFVAYIMAASNPKNLHTDYSRVRPDDITVMPRAFYVTTVKDREDFINKKAEIHQRVQDIYDENIEDIRDYNNQLPKLMLQDKMGELKTIDKILEWIFHKFIY